MTYKVSLHEFSKIVSEMGEKGEDATILGLQEAALYLEGIVASEIENASPSPAVNTGALKRSIKTTKTDTGAITSVDAPHAPFVEYGTRPHRPPIQPLVDWVLQKGIATEPKEAKRIAMGVSDSIAQHGTKPRFFMKKAVRKLYTKKIIKRFVDKHLAEIV